MHKINYLLSLLCLFVANSSLFAQATAQISGTVKDPSGAVLPGVEVTATQTDTGISRATLTNETEFYSDGNSPAGQRGSRDQSYFASWSAQRTDRGPGECHA